MLDVLVKRGEMSVTEAMRSLGIASSSRREENTMSDITVRTASTRILLLR